jgi:hypothetical protein
MAATTRARLRGVNRQLVGSSARVELSISAISARVVGMPAGQHDRDSGPRGRLSSGPAACATARRQAWAWACWPGRLPGRPHAGAAWPGGRRAAFHPVHYLGHLGGQTGDGAVGPGSGCRLGCTHEPGRVCWFSAGPARCESAGTAGLLYAVLAVGTAFAGIGPGHVLGLEGACPGTVLSRGPVEARRLERRRRGGPALIRSPCRRARRRARSARAGRPRRAVAGAARDITLLGGC